MAIKRKRPSLAAREERLIDELLQVARAAYWEADQGTSQSKLDQLNNRERKLKRRLIQRIVDLKKGAFGAFKKGRDAQLPDRVHVLCNNDYPHSVFLEEKPAELEAARLTTADGERRKREGGMQIYYHIKTVPMHKGGN